MRLQYFFILLCMSQPLQAQTVMTYDEGLSRLSLRFMARDKNLDGYLSNQELVAPREGGYPSMGARAAQTLIDMVDLDGNAHIDHDEFSQALQRYHIMQSVDRDHDGILSPDEQASLGF